MFGFIVKELWLGNSPTRCFLDYRLSQEVLKGKTFDLGAGSRDRYSKLIPRENDTEMLLFDTKRGMDIDFETDKLPFADDTCDTILFLNVLEHIYNYSHLLKEIARIKKSQGKLIGFVPFLMWFHPDHHDYFRYTHQALQLMLEEVGFKGVKIESIHYGPFTAGFQMTYTTMPRIVRIVAFTFSFLLDSLFRKLRPNNAERYALGYYFTAE